MAGKVITLFNQLKGAITARFIYINPKGSFYVVFWINFLKYYLVGLPAFHPCGQYLIFLLYLEFRVDCLGIINKPPSLD